VTAEQRREAQERMRERWKNMSPEQKARFLERREERLERRYGMLDSAGRQTWAREMQQERDRLRAQVDSGKVTPEQAREQMRDWMRRTLPAPDSARGRPPR
jgi:phage shock protein A